MKILIQKNIKIVFVITYLKNINGATGSSVIREDVRKVTVKQLKSISKTIDGFAYGFPCNDFSNVGEKLGFKGKFGPLYSYGVELINRYHPKWFVAENVGGIKSSNEGKSFAKILKDLEEAGKGYDLTVHKYKFEEYGIPQARHRVIIVGIKKELKLNFKVPKPTYKIMTAKKALSNIPKNVFNFTFL